MSILFFNDTGTTEIYTLSLHDALPISRVNYVTPKYDNIVVCTYDLSKFRASVVMDALRTHPVVIIGGILQENPFFIPPEISVTHVRAPVTPHTRTPTAASITIDSETIYSV